MVKVLLLAVILKMCNVLEVKNFHQMRYLAVNRGELPLLATFSTRIREKVVLVQQGLFEELVTCCYLNVVNKSPLLQNFRSRKRSKIAWIVSFHALSFQNAIFLHLVAQSEFAFLAICSLLVYTWVT